VWTVGVLVAASTVVVQGASAPAQAVPVMHFTTTTSASDTSAVKTQLVRCPIGLRLLSGGGYVGNGGNDVTIVSYAPLWGLEGDVIVDELRVSAAAMTRLDGTRFSGSWFLVAYAVCGTEPAGFELTGASTGISFATTQTDTAHCPLGKQLISAFGTVGPSTAWGVAMLDEVAPVGKLLNSVRITAHQTERPAPVRWEVLVRGICADPLPGRVVVQATSPLNSSGKYVNVLCPSGKRVHGLGGALTGTNGHAGINAMFPSQGLDFVTLRAAEDYTGYSANWQARAYAICA
jgi:hypothetical protein